MRLAPRLGLAAALLLLFGVTVPAQEAESGAASERRLEHALVVGPIPLPRPAFVVPEKDEPEDLLARMPSLPADLDVVATPAGALRLDASELAAIGARTGDGAGAEAEDHPTPEADGDDDDRPMDRDATPEVAGAARAEGHRLFVRLHARRFVTVEVAVEAEAALRIHLDGSQLAERREPSHAAAGAGATGARAGDDAEADANAVADAQDAGDDVPGAGDPPSVPLKARLVLEPGPHLLVLDLAYGSEAARPGVVVTLLGATDDLAAVTTPREGPRALSVGDLVDGISLGELGLSADGRFVSFGLRDPGAPKKDGRSWVEIRSVEGGFAAATLDDARAFRWLARKSFGFLKEEKEGKRRLWLGEPGQAPRPVGEPLERLESWAALPFDRGFLLIVEAAEDEREKVGMRRFRGLFDRAGSFRKRLELHVVDADGENRRLVAGGDLPIALQDVRSDGGAVLVSRPLRDLGERPFEASELVEIDLRTNATRVVARPIWFRGARYAPDGVRIAVAAGPSAFGGVGRAVDLDAGAIPNEYDRQLFLLERDGTVRPLTRDFAPSVDAFAWSGRDGRLYALCLDGEKRSVFRRAPEADAGWEEIADGVDSASAFAVSWDAPRLAVIGSSPRESASLRVIDLDDGSPREVLAVRPDAERYAGIELGAVRRFDVTLEDGRVLPGRVHYPPDFDERRSWPAIVYFYGGTLPSDLSFGGRYPKGLWAAQGYVVYVLTPSGAIGFGQKESARHVNDWGRTVTGEIVGATKAFLAAHPAVDAERVGCIGASFGGFMTMLLLTRTDLFATGISHAGISSIASYWGEGHWGWSYNAVAGAGSYPWNAPDLYVGQSALFAADRIEASLLLLHGASDTNVPKGESDQMYTALKILGKRVEYLQFEDEDHWILDHGRRALWMRCILAWFDAELKSEPGWWEHLIEDA